MLFNLTIALSVIVIELVVLAIAGVIAYAWLKKKKQNQVNENSFSEIEQEDLLALSEELGKSNKELRENLEKLDEISRESFSPCMGALRRGYQESLDSMKVGAANLMNEPPNIAMTCQAILEANQTLVRGMLAAVNVVAGDGEPVNDEEESPEGEGQAEAEEPVVEELGEVESEPVAKQTASENATELAEPAEPAIPPAAAPDAAPDAAKPADAVEEEVQV